MKFLLIVFILLAVQAEAGLIRSDKSRPPMEGWPRIVDDYLPLIDRKITPNFQVMWVMWNLALRDLPTVYPPGMRDFSNPNSYRLPIFFGPHEANWFPDYFLAETNYETC